MAVRLPPAIFFRRLIYEVASLIVTKLLHVFVGDPDLWNSVRNLGSLFLQNLVGQKHKNFGTISHNFGTWSHCQSENGVANYEHSRTGKLNLIYFGPQVAKNWTGVLTHPLAIFQRTGVINSIAFTRWQQRVAVKLGISTHSSICSVMLLAAINQLSLNTLLMCLQRVMMKFCCAAELTVVLC